MKDNPKFTKKPNGVYSQKVVEENQEFFDLETEEGCQKMLMLAFDELLETQDGSKILERRPKPLRHG